MVGEWGSRFLKTGGKEMIQIYRLLVKRKHRFVLGKSGDVW